jgi:hypothetical protein
LEKVREVLETFGRHGGSVVATLLNLSLILTFNLGGKTPSRNPDEKQ